MTDHEPPYISSPDFEESERQIAEFASLLGKVESNKEDTAAAEALYEETRSWIKAMGPIFHEGTRIRAIRDMISRSLKILAEVFSPEKRDQLRQELITMVKDNSLDTFVGFDIAQGLKERGLTEQELEDFRRLFEPNTVLGMLFSSPETDEADDTEYPPLSILTVRTRKEVKKISEKPQRT